MSVAREPCYVCHELPIDRIPYFCDVTPVAIRLPPDVHLCFWCRRDLFEFYGGTVEIDDAQITHWVAHCLLVAARRVAAKLPLKRCEAGSSKGRCRHPAVIERGEMWLCGHHGGVRHRAPSRHYMDWRCHRLTNIDGATVVLAPAATKRAVIPKMKEPGKPFSMKGSNNPGAVLDEHQVREIWKMIDAGGYNTTIGRRFGVTHSMISAIRRRKAWNHIVIEGEAETKES